MRRKVNPIAMQRLERLRKARGESIKHVAEALGMSYSFVYDLFRGKVAPSIDTLRLLAKYFNTTADYLLGLVDDPTPGPYSPGLKRLFRATQGLSEEDLEKVNQVVEAMISMGAKEDDKKKARRVLQPAEGQQESRSEENGNE